MYKSFVQGIAVESFDIKARTTQEHIAYVKSVFGSDYESDLGLSPEKADSKCRELVPLGKLVEKLNLDLELFKRLLFKIKDARLLLLEGVQGRRKDVTIGDLCQLKKALEDVVWTTTPRVRNPAVTQALAKAGRSTQNAQQFIDDQAAESDVRRNESLHRTTRQLSLRLPHVGKHPPFGLPLVQGFEQCRPDGPAPVSLPAKERTEQKVPAEALNMMRYRAQGCEPLSHDFEFEAWANSCYVHGHGLAGRFAYDPFPYDSNTRIRTGRLVGFHDASVRHLDEAYCNSWIILPMAPRKLLGSRWTEIMIMINYRALSQDDGSLERIENAPEDLDDVTDALGKGNAILAENVCGFSHYPFKGGKPSRLLEPEWAALLKEHLADGKAHVGEPQNVLDTIVKTENPATPLRGFFRETFVTDPVPIPDGVQALLPGKTLFATEGMADALRAPKDKLPAVREALDDVTMTMPRYYGDRRCINGSENWSRILEAAGLPDCDLPGEDAQPLPWRHETPRSLEKNGMYTKCRVEQVPWLEAQAMQLFSARRCIGFVGSVRQTGRALAGSCLWSLLYRGERLVLLHPPAISNKKSMSLVQKAGDLLIIPPGYEYAWYNIRTCISDEGYFYATENLVNKKVDRYLVPGSLDILLEKSSEAFGTSDHRAVIVYFMIVVLAHDLSKTAHENSSQSLAAKLYTLLMTPIYQWIRVPPANLNHNALQNTVKVLSWTAPFAAVVVHRLRMALKHQLEPSVQDDSMDLQEYDDGIVTDQEDYERPNPYTAKYVPETSPETVPRRMESPLSPTNTLPAPRLPLFFATPQSTQEQDREDAMEEQLGEEPQDAARESQDDIDDFTMEEPDGIDDD